LALRTADKIWAEKQGAERLNKYWKEKNSRSIDDFETEISGEGHAKIKSKLTII
jgi:hypothetical protein